ncbi:unnamed protein product [Chrysoparadoxa australica]
MQRQAQVKNTPRLRTMTPAAAWVEQLQQQERSLPMLQTFGKRAAIGTAAAVAKDRG